MDDYQPLEEQMQFKLEESNPKLMKIFPNDEFYDFKIQFEDQLFLFQSIYLKSHCKYIKNLIDNFSLNEIGIANSKNQFEKQIFRKILSVFYGHTIIIRKRQIEMYSKIANFLQFSVLVEELKNFLLQNLCLGFTENQKNENAEIYIQHQQNLNTQALPQSLIPNPNPNNFLLINQESPKSNKKNKSEEKKDEQRSESASNKYDGKQQPLVSLSNRYEGSKKKQDEQLESLSNRYDGSKKKQDEQLESLANRYNGSKKKEKKQEQMEIPDLKICSKVAKENEERFQNSQPPHQLNLSPVPPNFNMQSSILDTLKFEQNIQVDQNIQNDNLSNKQKKKQKKLEANLQTPNPNPNLKTQQQADQQFLSQAPEKARQLSEKQDQKTQQIPIQTQQIDQKTNKTNSKPTPHPNPNSSQLNLIEVMQQTTIETVIKRLAIQPSDLALLLSSFEVNSMFSLIYDGSLFEFKTQDIVTLCSKKEKLIFIVRNNLDKVFGFYLDSGFIDQETEINNKSFIFSVFPYSKLRLAKGKKEIFTITKFFLSFGDNGIVISNNGDQNQCRSALPNNFIIEDEVDFDYQQITKEKSFFLKEFLVYKIIQ